MECKNCRRNYKTLTKEKSCAFCYKKLKGEWPEEFQQSQKERDK